MSKQVKLSEGKVYKNRHGWFAKIIKIDGGHIKFAGWFPKESTAKEAVAPNNLLNRIGFARAMGVEAQIGEVDESTATDTGTDDTANQNDEGEDGEGTTDPYEGVTVPDLKAALRDEGLAVSGNRDELVARCRENGIEFETED